MKDPAVLFYTADFITGTITMTDEQRGQYILLLCLQHQKGVLTEKDMLKICNSHDEDIWSKFKLENGVYYNERMRVEANKRRRYSESRANNRKNKDVEENNTQDINNISKSYEKHMVNENININKDISNSINKEETNNKKQVTGDEIINEVYKAYPTKCPIQSRSLGKSSSDKKRIQKLLTKHTKEDLLFRIDGYISDCVKNKIFLKDFSTFLNNLPDIDTSTKNKKEMPEAFIYDKNGLGVKNPEYTQWQKQQA